MNRIDHYYYVEDADNLEDGHILVTVDEARRIEATLKRAFPGRTVSVEPGGAYRYTSEETPADLIAFDIIDTSGFEADPVGRAMALRDAEGGDS